MNVNMLIIIFTLLIYTIWLRNFFVRNKNGDRTNVEQEIEIQSRNSTHEPTEISLYNTQLAKFGFEALITILRERRIFTFEETWTENNE